MSSLHRPRRSRYLHEVNDEDNQKTIYETKVEECRSSGAHSEASSGKGVECGTCINKRVSHMRGDIHVYTGFDPVC